MASAPAAAQTPDIRVPSGRTLSLHEVLTDTRPGELWVRFRFISEGLSQAEVDDHDRMAEDMDWLCANLVLPYLDHHELKPDRVAISFSDRPVPFGEAAPDAVQVFEAYRIEDGACIWEGY